MASDAPVPRRSIAEDETDSAQADHDRVPIGGRITAIDAIRGVALLGILLLNIIGFALPDAAYLNPRAYGGWHGADLATYLVNFVFFDGKMRGLFSFLFGASTLLVIERSIAAGRDPAAVHFARMGWLLVFGLAHLWLIWRGDILTHYALVGMIAFAARKLNVARLVVFGGLLVLFQAMIETPLPIAIGIRQQAIASAATPAEASAHRRALAALSEGLAIPAPGQLAREIALHRGPYLPILKQRFAEERMNPVIGLVFMGAETLAYMLFGMAALRSGMLSGGWGAARYRRWLTVSWGIGLPVFVVIAAIQVRSGFDLFVLALTMPITVLARPPMIVGWICLLSLILAGESRWRTRLVAVGRMAFTNYLMTSLICTTIFYGYGLGWYASLSRWQLYPIVAAVWAAILLWSPFWLARFRFGPFEWLWRSLARGKVQPIRGGARNN